MTDNQDPLKALQTLIEDKENLSPAATPPTTPEANLKQNGEQVSPEGQKAATGGELTPEQQAAQQAANEAKEAELKARLEEHEAEQAVKDQEAIESLRGELPEVTPTSSAGEGLSNTNQDLAQETNSDEATKKVMHEVEQLKRLD